MLIIITANMRQYLIVLIWLRQRDHKKLKWTGGYLTSLSAEDSDTYIPEQEQNTPSKNYDLAMPSIEPTPLV